MSYAELARIEAEIKRADYDENLVRRSIELRERLGLDKELRAAVAEKLCDVLAQVSLTKAVKWEEGAERSVYEHLQAAIQEIRDGTFGFCADSVFPKRKKRSLRTPWPWEDRRGPFHPSRVRKRR